MKRWLAAQPDTSSSWRKWEHALIYRVLHYNKLFWPQYTVYCTITRCSDPYIPCTALFHAVLTPVFHVLHYSTLFRHQNTLKYAVLTPEFRALHYSTLFWPLYTVYCTIPRCLDTNIPCTALFQAVLTPIYRILHYSTLYWTRYTVYCTIPRCTDPCIPCTVLFHAV